MIVFHWKASEDGNARASAWPYADRARDMFMKMQGYDMPDEVWFIDAGTVIVLTTGEFMDSDESEV